MRGDQRELRHAVGAILAAVLLVPACEPEPQPEPEPEPGPLATADQWDWVADPSEDVFGAERPSDAICDETLGIGVELIGNDAALEIDTNLCNYATVRQPSLRALVPGDTISLRQWHYDLVAPSPSEAHLALALDGEVLWERGIPIPAAAASIDEVITVDREVPAGAELQFHVHNHGNNTYLLLAIEADPTGPR